MKNSPEPRSRRNGTTPPPSPYSSLYPPLAQLAADLAGDPPLTVFEAWTAERFRPLNEAASRLVGIHACVVGLALAGWQVLAGPGGSGSSGSHRPSR